MAQVEEIRVPDIGDFEGVPVIEVLVKPGDAVHKDQGLITLESDKATMEVPAPGAGTIKEVKVSEGDEVSEGTVIVTYEPSAGEIVFDASLDCSGEVHRSLKRKRRPSVAFWATVLAGFAFAVCSPRHHLWPESSRALA